MLIVDWIKIPVGVSLAVVGVILLTSILASLLVPNKSKHETS
jgi:hypothetical protein